MADKQHKEKVYLPQVTSFIERHAVLLTFLLCAAFLYPRMHYAFDVTDAGHHLSKAQVAFDTGAEHFSRSPFHFMTQYIAGVYLYVLEVLNLGLFEARLGWLALVAGSAALAVQTLRYVMPVHWLWPFIGLVAISHRTAYSKIPDYESVPAFLGALCMYFLVRAYREGTPKSQAIWGVGSGVALALLLLARLPAVMAIGLAFIPFLMWWNKGVWQQVKVPLMSVIGGLALSAFVLIVTTAGVDISIQPRTNLHSPSGVLHKLFDQFIAFFGMQLLVVGLSAIAILWMSKRSVKWLPLSLLIVLVHVYTYQHAAPLYPYTLATSVGIACIVAALLLYRDKLPNTPVMAILLCGAACIPFLLCLGSYGGFDKLANGAWFTVIVGLGVVASFRKLFTTCVIIVMLPILLYAGYTNFHQWSYGDLGDRRQLTATFEHPRLAGIQTQEGRKESVEGLLSTIEAHSNPGDYMLAYNNIPIMFYASNRRPIFHIPWIIARSEAIFSDIENWLCTDAETTPTLIVQTKVETRSATWGDNEEGPPIVQDIIQAKSRHARLTKASEKCVPEKVWENNDFVVYQTTVQF